MAPFLFLLVFLSGAASGCNSDPIVVTVPGDDVILLCPAPYPSIRAVEWIRADLEPDNVFLYRDGHLNTTNQHPSFKDRVELVDRDLKDGDVSLTLKNVSRHDNGTYECRLIIGGYDPFITMITIRLQITDLIVVTVHPGDDVILPCQAAGSPISFAEWTRPDLEPEYVLLYRDERLDTDYQNPSFKGRVELVDRDLKDRDVSLTLKNVRSIDAGTYRCGVIIGDTDPTRTIRTISIIRLQVTGSHSRHSEDENSMNDVPEDGNSMNDVPEDGNSMNDVPEDRNSSPGGRYLGLAAGVVVLVLVAAAVVGVLMYKRPKNKRSGPPAADEASADNFL